MPKALSYIVVLRQTRDWPSSTTRRRAKTRAAARKRLRDELATGQYDRGWVEIAGRPETMIASRKATPRERPSRRTD